MNNQGLNSDVLSNRKWVYKHLGVIANIIHGASKLLAQARGMH